MRRAFRSLIPVVIVTMLAGASIAATPTADDFAWLSGHWCLVSGDEFTEEHWLPPRGNLMLGVSHTVRGGKTTSFEFMRIEFGAQIQFIAQPRGQPPTVFRLTASGDGWARFENREHDFPQRIEYRRTGTGLHAEIAGPGKNGEQVVPYKYATCLR